MFLTYTTANDALFVQAPYYGRARLLSSRWSCGYNSTFLRTLLRMTPDKHKLQTCRQYKQRD